MANRNLEKGIPWQWPAFTVSVIRIVKNANNVV